MIASVQGLVTYKDNDSLVIVMGGVGLEVFASRSALELCREGEVSHLVTRLIVREDALILYGFANTVERDLFDVLLKISGVGPKLATQIISTMTIDNLRNAVMSDRVELLTRVPGIGKKTAQKIMIELKDKLPTGLDAIPMGGFDDSLNNDVMEALVSLGFSVVEAQTALQSLPHDAPKEVNERVRLALQYLSD